MTKNKKSKHIIEPSSRISRNWNYPIGIKVIIINMLKNIKEKKFYQRTRIRKHPIGTSKKMKE